MYKEPSHHVEAIVIFLLALASFLTINALQILNCDSDIIEISEGICFDDNLWFIVTAQIPCTTRVAGFPTNSVLTWDELVYMSLGISQEFILRFGLTIHEVMYQDVKT